MLSFLTNQPRYVRINMELLVILMLIAVLALVAFRRLDDLKEEDLRVQAKAILESGRVAISLNFAQQLLSTGLYEPPFSGEPGAVMNAADRAAIEAMLERDPIYPPRGSYNTPAGVGFRWYLVDGGRAKPAAVPVVTAITNGACPAGRSLADPPEENTDCDVRRF